MTFEQFLRLLLKRWPLIVICCLFFGVGSALGTKLITPTYQSTALVEVTVGNQADSNSLLAGQQLVQTEAVLATSDSVLREVASHYKGLTADQLADEVTATPRLNTQLFDISVQDKNPVRAAALANDVATTFARQQLQAAHQNTSQGNLLLIRKAHPAFNPIRPNIMQNAGAGLLAGLLLGVLLVVALELLEMRALTPGTLTQLLNMPVLATVWHTSSKKQEDLIDPRGHDPNIESYRMLYTSIEFAVDKSLQHLMVTSALPGEGKSTIAANLAIFMARAGNNTLLIDTNIYHPTVQNLFKLPTNSKGLRDLIQACRSIESNTLVSVRQRDQSHTRSTSQVDQSMDLPLEPFMHAVGIPNLWVMPCEPLRSDLPELLTSKTLEQLLKVIDKSGMDFVLFDAPAMLGVASASLLASKVKDVIFVIDTKNHKKTRIQQTKTLFAQTKANVLGCVANKQRYNPEDTAIYYQTDTESSERAVVATLDIDELRENNQITEITGNRRGEKLNSSSSNTNLRPAKITLAVAADRASASGEDEPLP